MTRVMKWGFFSSRFNAMWYRLASDECIDKRHNANLLLVVRYRFIISQRSYDTAKRTL